MLAIAIQWIIIFLMCCIMKCDKKESRSNSERVAEIGSDTVAEIGSDSGSESEIELMDRSGSDRRVAEIGSDNVADIGDDDMDGIEVHDLDEIIVLP